MLKKKQFSSQNANPNALKTSVLFQSNNKHDPKNYRPCNIDYLEFIRLLKFISYLKLF
jgi:hypothetical protein